MSVTTYSSLDKARRAVSLKSRNANLNGVYSQFEVRQRDTDVYVGGPANELAKAHPHSRLVAQYSAGYRTL